jgi:hypothetical protein
MKFIGNEIIINIPIQNWKHSTNGDKSSYIQKGAL